MTDVIAFANAHPWPFALCFLGALACAAWVVSS
jgi:hypothetical protein